MVDALHEIHRVLEAGGKLVDARPDSRVLAYVQRHKPRGYQLFGEVDTNRFELANDRASDLAIERLKSDGMFKRRRAGRFWHRVQFANLADLREYLQHHLRFVHRARWVVDASTRRANAMDPFVIRRAVRYEVLDRTSG